MKDKSAAISLRVTIDIGHFLQPASNGVRMATTAIVNVRPTRETARRLIMRPLHLYTKRALGVAIKEPRDHMDFNEGELLAIRRAARSLLPWMAPFVIEAYMRDHVMLQASLHDLLEPQPYPRPAWRRHTITITREV